MNKGLKLHFCKKCKKKRYFSKESIPNHNFKWTCSKGHVFVTEGVTVARVAAAIEAAFNTVKMKNLFDRDDIFYKELQRRIDDR